MSLKSITAYSVGRGRVLTYISQDNYQRLGEKGILAVYRKTFNGSNPVWCKLFKHHYVVELELRQRQIIEDVTSFDIALADALNELTHTPRS